MNLTSRKTKLIIAVLFVVIFAAGLFLGFIILREDTALFPKKPVIGTINVCGYMLTEEEREIYLSSIAYALENDSVVGVVLRVDSPGGYSSIVEDVYYALMKLNEGKPVIAIVERYAVSGGYYVALGSREIYAVPSAFVGNIGVIMKQPSMVIPSEAALESGPFKYTGLSWGEFPFVIKKGLDNFLSAVNSSRGNRLVVSLEELSLAKIYLSSEAMGLGLVDSMGSLMDAISRVADLAGVESYQIVDLIEAVKSETPSSMGYNLWKNSTKLSFELLNAFHPEPVSVYYLSPYYLETYRVIGAHSESHSLSSTGEDEEPMSVEEAVLVDRTHGNDFIEELLGTYFGKVVEKGLRVHIVESDSDLTELLDRDPKALLIIVPTVSYDPSEIRAIEKYVTSGGKLVLIHDPSISWARFINSIAQEFGMYFSDGYLYNTEDNYGIYRNIVVRDFTNHSLVSNLTKLTLFTATHVYTNDTQLAITSNQTYLSITERQGAYSPIVTYGNVTAIGDLTFLYDPYCNIGENDKFLNNLVEYLTN